MPKFIHDDVLDASLNTIKNNATRMTLCNAQPTTYLQAITTFELADVIMASGDFTVSDGDVSGRKVRVAAKTGIVPDNAGTGTHVALVDVTNTKLLVVDICPSKVVALDDLVDLAAWDCEIIDPV